VHTGLFAALNQWSREHVRTVHYQIKGLNAGTEHYSAIEAEVPDPADPHTLPDQDWIAHLQTADTIVIAGEALSHCVAGTVRDLANQLGDAHVHKLLLLTDCCSAVSGFEEAGRAFVEELVARGMRTAHSNQLFA
jgi:nicotinamidase-related amidase